MSARTIYYIECDTCGYQSNRHHESDLSNGVKTLRDYLVLCDWKITSQGDFCPSCAGATLPEKNLLTDRE